MGGWVAMDKQRVPGVFLLLPTVLMVFSIPKTLVRNRCWLLETGWMDGTTTTQRNWLTFVSIHENSTLLRNGRIPVLVILLFLSDLCFLCTDFSQMTALAGS